MPGNLLRFALIGFGALLAAGAIISLMAAKAMGGERRAFLDVVNASSVEVNMRLNKVDAAVDAVLSAAGRSSDWGIAASRQAFGESAQGALRANPAIAGLIFFEAFADAQAARAAGQPFTDGVIAAVAGGVDYTLVPTSLALNSWSVDVYPFRNARLDAAAAEAAAASIVSAVGESDYGEVHFVTADGADAAAMTAEGPKLIWLARSAARSMEDARKLGVVAALVDIDQLIEGAKGAEAVRRVSTLNHFRQSGGQAADLGGSGGFLFPGLAEHRLASLGEHGVMLSYGAPGPGLFGVGFLPSLLALGCGGALAYGVSLIGANSRRAAKTLKTEVKANENQTKVVEDKLQDTEQRFRLLAESTGAVPWAANIKERRFEYIGPQIEQITGYPAQTWFARGFWVDHVHPDDRHAFLVHGLRGVKPGVCVTREYRTRSADGKILHFRNTMTLLKPVEPGQEPTQALGFMMDITEIKTAQAAQERLQREAEAANRSKSEFLANMSHELRTPLNVVIGFSEVMRDELFGPLGARYRDYALSIHASGKHLLELINDVLDLSRIEAGKIELIEEETDISAVLASCRTLLHERASSAGLHIRLEIPAPIPFVMADGRRLKQVIINLISNAIKFTPPGGRITLRAQVVNPRGLGISVTDTGIGMTSAEIEVAMQQFGQIDNELSRQHDGTGLGLPIARSLTELHGGELSIESKKDIGTKVTLWLPLRRLMVEGPDGRAAQGGVSVRRLMGSAWRRSFEVGSAFPGRFCGSPGGEWC